MRTERTISATLALITVLSLTSAKANAETDFATRLLSADVATTESASTPTPKPHVETIEDLITSFYVVLLDREPERGAVDAWRRGYFNYAINFNIDVLFVPREMARMFFLSREYEDRHCSREEFITDCYLAFLNRPPTEEELRAWLAGEWDRQRVMTVFSESEEFAERIDAMYPYYHGDPARNFITIMYIGFFDRLVDSEGLAYFAEEFGRASDKRQRAIQMAGQLIDSTEFRENNYTPAEYVERYYRAFLGRFPDSAETAYWTKELEKGRETYKSLIQVFAQSPEFSLILNRYFPN